MPRLGSRWADGLEFRKILEIDNEDWGHCSTCVGYTKQERQRCHNRIRLDNQGLAQDVLDNIDRCRNLDQLKVCLQEVAEASLCTRWHKNQTEEIAQRWMRTLQPFIDRHRDPILKPRKEKRSKQVSAAQMTPVVHDKRATSSSAQTPHGQLGKDRCRFQPQSKVNRAQGSSGEIPDIDNIVISVDHLAEQQRAPIPENQPANLETPLQSVSNNGPSSSTQQPSKSPCFHVNSRPRLTVRLGQYASIQCSFDRNLPSIIEISPVKTVMTVPDMGSSAVQKNDQSERSKAVQQANDAPHTDHQPLQAMDDTYSSEESLSSSTTSSEHELRTTEDECGSASEGGSDARKSTPDDHHSVGDEGISEESVADETEAEERETEERPVKETEGEKAEVEDAETEKVEGGEAEVGEIEAEEKTEDGESKAEEGTEDDESKAEETEDGKSKAEEETEDGDSKAKETEDGESKAEEGTEDDESKAEEGTEDDESKAEETEDGESKAEEGTEDDELKAEETEDGESKAEEETEDGESKAEESESVMLISNQGKIMLNEGEERVVVQERGQEEQKGEEEGDGMQETAQVEKIEQKPCEISDPRALQDDAQDEGSSAAMMPDPFLTRVLLYTIVGVAGATLFTMS